MGGAGLGPALILHQSGVDQFNLVVGLQADDEVELVYAGLMENERGAQASAAHWEAKNLSDDDIADLGYGPEGDAADERTA